MCIESVHDGVQARGSCPRFEALLASQRRLVFEQQGEPLGRIRTARKTKTTTTSDI
jgi:hypothetical protein